MRDVYASDDSWSRLGWQVPLAAALTMLGSMGFLRLLEPPPAAMVSRPIEVQIAELTALVAPPPIAPRIERRPPPVPERQPAAPPPPAAERRPAAPPPPAASKRRPAAPLPPAERPQALPPAVERAAPPPEAAPPRTSAAPPAAEPSPAARDAAPTAPAPASPLGTLAAGPLRSGPESAPRAPATEPPRVAAPAPLGKGLGGGSAGARAIYQPLPEIPESLRHRSIEITAVARFRVAASGAAEVELTEPTGDADLNRAVLDSLRRWRFFPALQDGKPVASTVDIRIPISVK